MEDSGVWFAAATDPRQRILATTFSTVSEDSALKNIKRHIPAGYQVRTASKPSRAAETLARVYRGRSLSNDISLMLDHISPFKRRVYEKTFRIPRGRVSTYGRLARLAGSARAARAVGSAMATNPFTLLVPCHRVLPSTLKVGNYSMESSPEEDGPSVKRQLLKREGVILEGKKISRSCLWP